MIIRCYLEILLLLITALAIYPILFFPLQVIRHCWKSKDHSKTKKILWSIVIVGTVGLAAMVYVMTSECDTRLRNQAIGCLVLWVFCTVPASAYYRLRWMGGKAVTDLIHEDVTKLQHIRMSNLSDGERQQFEMNLQQLSNEASIQWLEGFMGDDRLRWCMSLSQLASIYLRGPELNRVHFEDWKKTFQARRELSWSELQEHNGRAESELSRI